MNISFIGSGNVATHLALLLLKSNHRIIHIYSEHFAHANKLAKKVNATAVKNLDEVANQSQCVIVAVKDEAIADVIKKLPSTDCLILHTSGTQPIEPLKDKFINCGVLYPVQTFSKNSPTPKLIPFCIEAGHKNSLAKIKKIASSISKSVHVMSSKKRLIVHLTAVMSNNFSNHLFALSEHILKKNKLSFKMLHPLITETLNKIQHQSPSKIQTGPAVRNDNKTIQTHLSLLKSNKKQQELYKSLTKSILTFTNY